MPGLDLFPPAPPTAPRNPTVADMKKAKVVLIAPRDLILPRVRASQLRAKSEQARAPQYLSGQEMISQPRNAPPGEQIIYRPQAKKESAPPELLRNRVDFEGPTVEKAELGPSPVAKPPDPPPSPKPAPKAFVPPPVKKADTPSPPDVTLEQTPEMARGNPQVQTPAVLAGQLPKAPPRQFVAPPTQPKLVAPQTNLEAAPDVGLGAVRGSAAGQSVLMGTGRPAVNGPPPPPSAKPGAGGGSGTNGKDNVAVIGLREGTQNQTPPDTRRDASFASAKLPGAPDPGRGNQNTASLSLPSVGVGAPGAKPPDPRPPGERPVAPSGPRVTFEVKSQAVSRLAGFAVPLSPGSRRPAAVDAVFTSRRIFTILIPMTDQVRHRADWTLWFAETDPNDPGGRSGRMSPPVPLRKTDTDELLPPTGARIAPVYVMVHASVSADGRVTVKRIVNSQGALDDFVRRDLERWTFRPAANPNGATQVEVLFEVPYVWPPRPAAP
jgi:hypothetical protein